MSACVRKDILGFKHTKSRAVPSMTEVAPSGSRLVGDTYFHPPLSCTAPPPFTPYLGRGREGWRRKIMESGGLDYQRHSSPPLPSPHFLFCSIPSFLFQSRKQQEQRLAYHCIKRVRIWHAASDARRKYGILGWHATRYFAQWYS